GAGMAASRSLEDTPERSTSYEAVPWRRGEVRWHHGQRPVRTARNPCRGLWNVERIWTTELSHRAGERVCLRGWLHRLRRMSRVSFLVLRDAKGLAQVVVDDPDLFATLAGLHHESVLEVEATAVAEPQAPGGV